ncbi:MAG: response regulator [Rhodospirillaceae bacterium]|nr:response regulator [Rhodospirillaceae bacterium]MBT4046674.1 response regulator [Rhodospirillaceae bacterium]MBT4691252.1 response regulator [Rhodospirillaceae bacterium]MBT5082539.1 response regulator [Rhodospirillaceae bacterium]MBT5525414.1 response regulator [Rhodospirillaceae bacterium]
MAKILVAEDEEAVRSLVARVLSINDHDVKAVADGSAALEALSLDQYDLLLTDIVMPNVDGIALALKASAEYPGLRILMMTGYAEQKRRAHNLDVLIHDVISKPFTIDELAAAVERTLAAE